MNKRIVRLGNKELIAGGKCKASNFTEFLKEKLESDDKGDREIKELMQVLDKQSEDKAFKILKLYREKIIAETKLEIKTKINNHLLNK
ncbi:hypothetical protein [Clostridium thermobutyricum]|uniref:hypothetical protein n=1 Tax=Clostridium thermobutyricum TaxID=29372 RepID=UPI0018AAC1B0|nr:hypothetical protein [Clostridium thermobutyricum]